MERRTVSVHSEPGLSFQLANKKGLALIPGRKLAQVLLQHCVPSNRDGISEPRHHLGLCCRQQFEFLLDIGYIDLEHFVAVRFPRKPYAPNKQSLHGLVIIDYSAARRSHDGADPGKAYASLAPDVGQALLHGRVLED